MKGSYVHCMGEGVVWDRDGVHDVGQYSIASLQTDHNMARLFLAVCLTAVLLGSDVRANPICSRSPGEPAAIDLRIWARPTTDTTTGISSIVNGQESFVVKTADDFTFQPARRPRGSEMEYNLVGVMTFDVVLDEPREMYYFDNTSTSGADVSHSVARKHRADCSSALCSSLRGMMGTGRQSSGSCLIYRRTSQMT